MYENILFNSFEINLVEGCGTNSIEASKGFFGNLVGEKVISLPLIKLCIGTVEAEPLRGIGVDRPY